MFEDSMRVVRIQPPSEPGFYHYSGGAQRLMFLLTPPGNGSQWYAIFDNGVTEVCDWEFIEQALDVWKLVKVVSSEGNGV
jgi:hypothetical protein